MIVLLDKKYGLETECIFCTFVTYFTDTLLKSILIVRTYFEMSNKVHCRIIKKKFLRPLSTFFYLRGLYFSSIVYSRSGAQAENCPARYCACPSILNYSMFLSNNYFKFVFFKQYQQFVCFTSAYSSGLYVLPVCILEVVMFYQCVFYSRGLYFLNV